MKLKRKGGFTLVEILISISVAIIVGGLILNILVNNTGLFYKQSSRVQLGLGVNDALTNIRQNIKQSQSVAATYPSVTPFIYTTGTDILVLKVLSIDSSGEIIPTSFDYFVYYLEGLKLHMAVFPDGLSSRNQVDQILTNNVTSMFFQYFDASGIEVSPSSAARVKVTINLQQTAGNITEVNTAATEANLRND